MDQSGAEKDAESRASAKAGAKGKARAKAKAAVKSKASAKPKAKEKAESNKDAVIDKKAKGDNAETMRKPREGKKDNHHSTRMQRSRLQTGGSDEKDKLASSISSSLLDSSKRYDRQNGSNALSDTFVSTSSIVAAREPSSEDEYEDGTDVLLHIYDLHKMTKMFAMPFYHLGVEVYGLEICFGVEGLVWCNPGMMGGHVHKKVLNVGRTYLSWVQIQRLVERLHSDWQGSTYKLL